DVGVREEHEHDGHGPQPVQGRDPAPLQPRRRRRAPPVRPGVRARHPCASRLRLLCFARAASLGGRRRRCKGHLTPARLAPPPPGPPPRAPPGLYSAAPPPPPRRFGGPPWPPPVRPPRGAAAPAGAAELRPVTVPDFLAAKQRGSRLAVLTAYDYTMARLLD